MPNCLQVRVTEGITRRLWLTRIGGVGAFLSALSVFAQDDFNPLGRLKSTHPRLILSDSDFDRLRNLSRDNPLAHRIYMDMEKECDRLLSSPPVDHRLTGPRLQPQAHRALDRIVTLSLMFRISGRDPWLRRAIMELNAVASFRDWNPARFIETAELIHACSIGYDWLFNFLSIEERGWLREAILAKGLDQAQPLYAKSTGWPRERLHWNVVCNAAVAMGALAIGEEALAKTSAVFKDALESIPHGLGSWNEDGSWPDGPLNGESAARAACLLFASLNSALGHEFTLSGFHGLDRFGRFRMYSISPGGRYANAGDAPDDAGLAPEMFWMARRYNAPAYSWSEQRQLERNPHPEAYDLAWFERDSKPPQPPAWPLDAAFSSAGLATFRSSWDDPAALFLAVKPGAAFAFEAGGVRWASDSGPEPKADVHFTRQEFGPDLSWVQFDLAKLNPKLKQWTRRFGMAQRQAVLIEDSLASDQPIEIAWSLATDIDFSIDGPVATFHRNGWNMSAEIRTPRHAVFDAAPARTPGAGGRRLIVRLLDKVTEIELNIVLTPWREGQPQPKINTQFPA